MIAAGALVLVLVSIRFWIANRAFSLQPSSFAFAFALVLAPCAAACFWGATGADRHGGSVEASCPALNLNLTPNRNPPISALPSMRFYVQCGGWWIL